MKNYKIAVAGTGYVGLSLSVLLAQHNQVMAVDIVQAKVDMINNHKSPIQDDYIEKYSNYPILLLDEATSALDEATALRLLNNLRKMTDKTVILVTHRMNQAEFFDAELAFSKDGICVRERKTCK